MLNYSLAHIFDQQHTRCAYHIMHYFIPSVHQWPIHMINAHHNQLGDNAQFWITIKRNLMSHMF